MHFIKLKTMVGIKSSTNKMTIEQRFLQKAVEDKNYVSFSHEGKSYKRVKPLKIEGNILHSDSGKFELGKLSRVQVLKIKF